jgi:putative ABC transport system substrate-binding protein
MSNETLTARRNKPFVSSLRTWIGFLTRPLIPGLFRRSATYVDKIIKGAKPADLLIEQPTKFDFVVNLKTAKTLGLELPSTLVARADEVIE